MKVQDVNKTIVESSIVFVSIFATIGLLIGASSSQFKTTYVYLGYMLIYSLPFILSCSFGLVSMVSADEDSPIARVMALTGITFFVTGLLMLVFLADSAASTSVLPTSFVFFAPYNSLPVLEVYIFVISLGFLFLGLSAISEFKSVWRKRNWITSFSAMLFIMSILVMMVIGVTQTSRIAASGTIFLAGNPSYPMENVSFPLVTTDQIQVRMNSDQNADFSYVFLDQINYLLYNDPSSRLSAIPLDSGDFAENYSFAQVITASSDYYLVLRTRFIDNNVTFSVQVVSTNSSLQVDALFFSAAFISTLIGSSMARPNFYQRALALSKDKNSRWKWLRHQNG
jgi:hypothetical protein